MATVQRSFVVAYAVWLFGTFSYFVPGATWSPVSRFATTRAIVEQGTLSIDAFATATGDRARAGGRWYSDKAPIPALVAVVPYTAFRAFDELRGTAPAFTAVGTDDVPARRVYVNASFQRGLYVCSLLTSGLAAVGLALALFSLLARRVGAKPALVGSMATMVCTPILPYATSFYGHVPAAAFLAGAVALVAGNAGPLPRRRALLAGACLALAPGCEYIVAVPSALIGAWVVWRAPRSARLDAVRYLACGAALPIAVVSAYHWACFGAPWRTGYSFIARPEFAAGHATGLLGVRLPTLDGLFGLLLGTRRGLFYIAPIAVAGVAGAIVAVRARLPGAGILGVVALVLLILNSGYYMWWGGAATGPRHLVPVFGVLAVGLAVAWRHPTARPVVLVLALLSFVNVVVLTGVGLEAPERGNVLTQYAFPAVAQGRIAHVSGASNLGVLMGLAPAATLGPVIAWVLIGARLLMRRLDAEESSWRGDVEPAAV